MASRFATCGALTKLQIVLSFVGLCLALTQEEEDAFYGNITLADHPRRRFSDYYLLQSDGMPDYESGRFSSSVGLSVTIDRLHKDCLTVIDIN